MGDVQPQEDVHEDDESRTVSTLRNLHCCQRCVLRFLGRKTIFVYSNPSLACPSLWKQENGERNAEGKRESSIDGSGESLGERDPGSSKPEPEEVEATAKDSGDAIVPENERELCPACLGILQQLCNEEFVDKICSDVKEMKYDFDSFMLSLTLPLQLDIRQHCLLTHLNEVCKSSLKSSDITPVKDVFKWVCGPLFTDNFKVSFSPKSHFEVGLTFEHEETKNEVDILYNEISDVEPANKRRKYGRRYSHGHGNKEGPTKQLIGSALRGLTPKHLQRLLPHPPASPKGLVSHSIECLHEPVHFAGRYTKHSRHLSQTPWILDGERKTESSVEELICTPLREALRAADFRFSSSGREDVDVRTLGRGRPFVAEMVNPRRSKLCDTDCKVFQEEINRRTTDVGVRDLQVVGRNANMMLKEGETEKQKSYMALVRVASAVRQEDLEFLADKKELVLQQKTPLRVLHRRPLATRERTVHSMSAEVVDSHNFKLFLCTQAGTYIKEFVHGDLGRTVPNIGTLLNTDADILELDVTAVHVDWPKKLEDDDVTE